MEVTYFTPFFPSRKLFNPTSKIYVVPLCVESLSICSENESEDNMDVGEAKSEAASNEDMEDDEQYETITMSEALDEERYDQDIDMNEEKQAMEKFKGSL